MKNFLQAIEILLEIINLPGASSLTPYEMLAKTYMLMGDSCYHLGKYELVKGYLIYPFLLLIESEDLTILVLLNCITTWVMYIII